MLLWLAAALEELMLRCVNPLRKFMVWNREVRHGTATFRAFRSAMVDLVKEVRARSRHARAHCWHVRASMHAWSMTNSICMPSKTCTQTSTHGCRVASGAPTDQQKGCVTAHETTLMAIAVGRMSDVGPVQQHELS